MPCPPRALRWRTKSWLIGGETKSLKQGQDKHQEGSEDGRRNEGRKEEKLRHGSSEKTKKYQDGEELEEGRVIKSVVNNPANSSSAVCGGSLGSPEPEGGDESSDT